MLPPAISKTKPEINLHNFFKAQTNIQPKKNLLAYAFPNSNNYMQVFI